MKKPPSGAAFFVRSAGALPASAAAAFAVAHLAVGVGHVKRAPTLRWVKSPPLSLSLPDPGNAVSHTDVITSEAALRYADALIELADETRGATRGVERDMKSLRAMFKASPELLQMVRSPVIAGEFKARALTEIADTDGFHPLSRNFLGTVAQNQRARELPAIVDAFAELMAEKRGAKIARVRSAAKLSAAQLKDLKAKLADELGGKVQLDTEVDPSLLGGFVVQVGSRLYDSSLRTQLDDLKLALKA